MALLQETCSSSSNVCFGGDHAVLVLLDVCYIYSTQLSFNCP